MYNFLIDAFIIPVFISLSVVIARQVYIRHCKIRSHRKALFAMLGSEIMGSCAILGNIKTLIDDLNNSETRLVIIEVPRALYIECEQLSNYDYGHAEKYAELTSYFQLLENHSRRLERLIEQRLTHPDASSGYLKDAIIAQARMSADSFGKFIEISMSTLNRFKIRGSHIIDVKAEYDKFLSLFKSDFSIK